MAETILIVDDDLVSLDFMGSGLIAQGYKALIAYTADLAVEILLQNQVDLLITDVEMPEKDGFFLVEQVRKIIKYRKLPIIMLFTSYDKGEIEKGSKYDVKVFLKKPFEQKELLKTVSGILSKDADKKRTSKEVREREIFNKLSVLVVDDEENIREMLHEYLKTFIKYVNTAGGFEEATVLLQEHHFNIVISDIKMPDRSGFDLIEWINEFPETAGMPVIMMTGVMKDAASVKRAKQLWIDKFLAKPFNLNAIRSILLEIGSREYQLRKLIKFKKHIIDQEKYDSKEENIILSGQRRQIFDLKKDFNKLSRQMRSYSQETHSKELSELNIRRAKLDSSINQKQEDIGDTKRLFFERRKLFATIKRFNVQRIEKLKN